MWSCVPACLPACLFQLAYCLSDQAHFAWFTSWVPRGHLRGRRRPLMEEDLQWKTTFDGRRPSMEDDLQWKITFDGRRPLIEDDHWRKTTFEGRWPLTEDDLWRKTTFDGRRPSVGLQDITWKKYFRLLTLTATAELTLNRKSYQLSKPEIEFHVM